MARGHEPAAQGRPRPGGPGGRRGRGRLRLRHRASVARGRPRRRRRRLGLRHAAPPVPARAPCRRTSSPSDEGPHRKYYAVTAAGRDAADDRHQDVAPLRRRPRRVARHPAGGRPHEHHHHRYPPSTSGRPTTSTRSGPRLADLPADERDDLLDDLEAHVHQVAATTEGPLDDAARPARPRSPPSCGRPPAWQPAARGSARLDRWRRRGDRPAGPPVGPRRRSRSSPSCARRGGWPAAGCWCGWRPRRPGATHGCVPAARAVRQRASSGSSPPCPSSPGRCGWAATPPRPAGGGWSTPARCWARCSCSTAPATTTPCRYVGRRVTGDDRSASERRRLRPLVARRRADHRHRRVRARRPTHRPGDRSSTRTATSSSIGPDPGSTADARPAPRDAGADGVRPGTTPTDRGRRRHHGARPPSPPRCRPATPAPPTTVPSS